MEQNLPIVAKKFWNTVRVIYFMLRKGIISKRKLLADLNVMLNRGKVAGKAAIQNLMAFHHHSDADAPYSGRRSNERRLSFPAAHLNEHEFSCSNSPAFFHLNKRGRSPPIDGELVSGTPEMMTGSPAASPYLPGFGPTPMVKQLRITDSPFPLRDVEDGSYHVDEAAEEFIMRFYKDLKRQNEMAYLGYS